MATTSSRAVSRGIATVAPVASTRRKRRGIDRAYYVMLVPVVALFTLFIIVPAAIGVFYSFTNFVGYGAWHFVGLTNYLSVFTDPTILHAYGFTLLFAVITTIIVNIIALSLAMGLNSRIRFRVGLRGLFFVPMVISGLVIAYVFNYFFSTSLPAIAQSLHIGFLESSALASPHLAFAAIVIVSAWQACPGAIIIYLAGLLAIPTEVYEAGSIDGATNWRKFTQITFPLVFGYLIINTILGFKGFLNAYEIIVALTNGGPGTSTFSVTMAIFTGFTNGDYAYQMANAVIFFIVAVVFSLLQLSLIRRRGGLALMAMLQDTTKVPLAPPELGRRRRRRVTREEGRVKWGLTVLMCLAGLTVIIPFYFAISMSLKTAQQAISGTGFGLPWPLNFGNFHTAWTLTHFPKALFWSALITAVAVAGELLLSSVAAYAIVRNWEHRGFRYVYFYLLAAMFIPFPVIALPQISLTARFSLDNPAGVAILHILFGLSFNVLLYSAFLRSIPLELEESARMDGCSTWSVFRKMIFPLLAPMNATVGIFAFLASWNDFQMPNFITANPSHQTLPVVQALLQNQFSTNYNVSFASYLMAMAPSLIGYIIAQRWVMSGLMRGAIK